MNSSRLLKRWLVPSLVGLVALIFFVLLHRSIFGRSGKNSLASLIVICVLFIVVWLMKGSSSPE